MTDLPAHVPPELVIDFDLHDPKFTENLVGYLDGIRESTPVAYCPNWGGYWLVTRYSDIHAVLRDTDTFSSWPATVPRKMIAADRLIPIEYDPPDHGVYQKIISPLFAPKRMRELAPQIRSTVRKLLDDIAPKGSCEFIEEFARPLPSTVFLLLMGWPVEDADKFQTWTRGILCGDPTLPVAESNAVRRDSALAIREYFLGLLDERRRYPADDFTNHLITAAHPTGRLLNDDELVNCLFLLMLAGLHTVQSSLGYAVIYLAQHPEQQQSLVDDPENSADAVEEMLRWEAPAWPGRRALRDVSVGGVDVKAEDIVVLAVTAANHDEREFPDANRVDLAREPNRHLTFGGGPHRCTGSHLGRIELRIAFEELHSRIKDYRLDPDRPPVRHLGSVNGVDSVNLIYTSN